MAIIPAADLYKSISSFEIDEGKPALSFTRRLARENGWAPQFAQRVVDEYKRFMYLACVATHPVTPSDAIDQAWHLHLTYTRSYWDRFCGQVLRKPVHHDPTRGGEEEGLKFADQYERTVAAYINAFRATPPEDIWPPCSIRFGEEIDAVRVPRSQFVIMRKPRAVVGVVAAVFAVILTWIIAKWNSGPNANVARSSFGSIMLVVGMVAFLGVIVWLGRNSRGGGGSGGSCGGGGCGSSCGSGCGGGCGGD